MMRFKTYYPIIHDFPGGSAGKESACHAGDLGSIPGLGRSPGGGHGNPLQYSCLENPTDRGTWKAVVHSHKELDTTEVTKPPPLPVNFRTFSSLQKEIPHSGYGFPLPRAPSDH